MPKKKSKKKYYQIHHILWVISMGMFLVIALAYIIFDISIFTPQAHAQSNPQYQKTNNSTGQQLSTNQYTKKKIMNALTQIIKQSQEQYQNNFDFTTDSSLQRYISNTIPLHNIHYIPVDLEEIHNQYISSKIKHPQLRSPARIAFEKLAKDFYDTFHQKLILKSAYRSYKTQTKLIQNGCSLTKCARPWTSEHQLWLAVDLQIENNNGIAIKLNNTHNKYYKRLDQNAHRYGFHNTYKKWLHTNTESIMEEHRHRRYCSIPLASFLFQKKLSLGEYVESQYPQG